ncbi:MAG: esterase family protein, partial [Planctomycetaceae bacterium]|nr:esterase family protein [Planctomycetaceae bacterium]
MAVIPIAVRTAPASAQEESYPTPPEAMVHEGVPRGKVDGPFEFRSQLYPGTVREYWIYVPAQYDPAKPPCLMIVQDGMGRAGGWKIPTILDNLIHAGEVPVQLGIFVGHGSVPASNENAQPRFNRSFEYDGLGDRYARFLIEELLPEVRKSYEFSDNPNDRCLAGSSSGAICAFNAAWERPDAFRRVISTVGTYVGLRGGDQFPVLVRKTEPKPLRIFLQDGSNDLDIYGGSWWHANQAMLSALQFSGYDVKHVWGEGGH